VSLPEYHPAVALRVVVADDDYLVREGAASLLASVAGVEVVATASDLDTLLAAVDEHAPDVVLTDIRMPPGHRDEGIQAAHRLRSTHPSTGVVVLSNHLDPDLAHELFRDGAEGRGYLLKERVSEVEELTRALTEVARGGTVLDPQVVARLLARPDPPLAALTEREREVLDLMARGHTDAAIEDELGLSDRTVDKHVRAVFAKLGLLDEPDVHRRVMAVLEYLRSAPSER
jgi:DNA-binding NarL/FixJ family response regulator